MTTPAEPKQHDPDLWEKIATERGTRIEAAEAGTRELLRQKDEWQSKLAAVEAERDRALKDVADMSTGAWGSSAAMIVALKHRAEAAETERDRLAARGEELMTEVFVLFNDGHDEKSAIVYPDIYGPFDSEELADSFIRKHPRAHVFPEDDPYWPGAVVISPLEGGYAAAHIVSRQTAVDPVQAEAEWMDE